MAIFLPCLVPMPARLRDGVQDGQELVHNCDECDLLAFAGSDHPRVVRSHRWVVTRRGKGRHVQGLANVSASSPDRSMATHLTRITIQRSDADKRSNASSAQHTKLRQSADQRGHRGRTDASDAGECGSQVGVVQSDVLCKLLLDTGDLGLHEVDGAAQARLRTWMRTTNTLPLCDENVNQLAAALHQRRQSRSLGIGHWLDEAIAARVLMEHSRERCQCSSVDAVCLGKNTCGAREVAAAARRRVS